VDEEANYACSDELEKAAAQGLVFVGHHDAGGSYPAMMFASDGHGQIYYVTVVPGEGIVVPINTATNNVSVKALSNVRAYQKAAERAEDMMAKEAQSNE
jgi:hypothetical protein